MEAPARSGKCVFGDVPPHGRRNAQMGRLENYGFFKRVFEIETLVEGTGGGSAHQIAAQKNRRSEEKWELKWRKNGVEGIGEVRRNKCEGASKFI